MEDKLLQSLEWRLIGPHRGGRVVRWRAIPSNRGTFYFGACAGGVWKTTSGGILLGEHLRRLLQDLGRRRDRRRAVRSQRHLRRDGRGRASAATSRTATASTSRPTAAQSWTNVGLADTRHIGKIVIHPDESRPRLRGGASATPGARTRSAASTAPRTAAQTWEQVLYKSDEGRRHRHLAWTRTTRASSTPAIWEAQRYPHALDSGGEDAASGAVTDGGDTWTEITRNPGLPTGHARQDRRGRLRRPGRARLGASSRPRMARSSAPTTAARPGSGLSENRACARGPGTTCTSSPTRRTPTPSGSSI